MPSRLRTAAFTLAACLAALGGTVAISAHLTERDITAFETRVTTLAQSQAAPGWDPTQLGALPEPVQRYFRFTFPEGAPTYSAVHLSASGQFRRPQTEGFNPTTAHQVIAAGVPALMFSATTPVLPGIWARAYDFYADGQMEMKAKILSTLTVVDEKETPALNQISLRRWLLESALYPAALLPGGPVSWEPIDAQSARAVVSWGGMSASLVAHFASDGHMTHMQAESDGDLDTPYHGSGEHVSRSDYQQVNGQMIPMAFTISRMAGGQLYPFWRGRVDSIRFEPLNTAQRP
ncbi:MAG: DUF6544 family protein [Burkholderiaceae bacterium]